MLDIIIIIRYKVCFGAVLKMGDLDTQTWTITESGGTMETFWSSIFLLWERKLKTKGNKWYPEGKSQLVSKAGIMFP